MFEILGRGIIIGIGGTLAMDIWAVVLWKVFGQSRPNWAPVGRWTWHLQSGKVFHNAIGDAPAFAQEQALGWLVHYAVGIIYGVVLAAVMGAGWVAAPTLLPALIWGWLTVAAGWFLLQPGLGIGWAASKTPNPTKVRALNLVAHSFFGAGMWLTALVLAA